MDKKMRKYIFICLIITTILLFLSMTDSDVVKTDMTKYIIPPSGCSLYIDLDALIMTVYVDGNIFKTYSVSGGTKETPSPVGIWHVNVISDWGEGFGGSWVGLDVPWGVYGIHGTRKPWLVGKQNASHGCIRMKDEDAKEVKNLVTLGTVVIIKQDSLPFRNMGNGTAGSDVYNMQIMLKNMGFYTGTIDGIYGKGMERAVKSFQRTYHMKDDGIIRKSTYEKIVEQSQISNQLHFRFFT
ncbi:MAG: L,D-transpeptidase family protein [Bacillota bacterium]|jgi:hypothetical protein